MKPSLKQSVANFFKDLIPVQIRTRFDARSMSTAIAHTITVDKVHAILRSAENGNTDELFALYRDIILAHSHLQGQIATRKRAVLGDLLALHPFDKKAAADKAAVDLCWPLTRHLDWFDACNHLLDSCLWPVAVVEKVFRPGGAPGQAYALARLIPVPHELLDFRDGRLRIKDVDSQGRPLSTCHDADPNRYIIHRGHMLTTPDHWGGPMRSLIFWWLLGTMDREWWARFLDRYASPFTVAKVDQGDDESRSILERALALSTKLGGLVVSRETEVEIKAAAVSDSGQAYEKFHSICNEEISKLILGQTLSADAKATGMGSGVANAQESVRDDIRQFDAHRLGFTLTTQLAEQLLRINGQTGAPPIFVWGAMSVAAMKAKADLLASLKNSGLRLTDDGITALGEETGLSLERDEGGGAANPFMPFSAGIRTYAARPPGNLDEIARRASASLARSLGKHHAPIAQIIREARTPQEALTKIEAYSATYESHESARIIEEALIAYAANGAVLIEN